MKQIVIAAALVAGLALSSLSSCARRTESSGAGEGAKPAAAPTVSVRARAVEERLFPDVVTAAGRWRASGEVVVVAPFAGTLDSLRAQPGDHVAAGQTLCRLLTRESRAALRGAELLARQARDEAARAEAARAIDLARREAISVPVTAPRAGVVTRVSAPTGSEVAESAEILALLPPEGIVFEARVRAADAARVKAGQRATIAGEARAPRETVVSRVLPAVSEGDQATLVWLTTDGHGEAPGLDRFGTATVVVGPARRASAVPDSALVQDDLTGETRIALIGPDDRALWRSVSPGVDVDGWRELLPPAPVAGALVITEGQRGLADSTLVRRLP